MLGDASLLGGAKPGAVTIDRAIDIDVLNGLIETTLDSVNG